jgi:alkylation response protein AidB-like acyl-CoA dehydrogenase
MNHYIANLNDIKFCLFEMLKIDELFKEEIFSDLDLDTVTEMLNEIKRLSENELASSYTSSDKEKISLDKKTGNVALSDSFKKSYQSYIKGDWGKIDTPVELGGILIPPSVRWSIAEMVLGSNPAVHLYASGYAFAQVAYNLGNEYQKKLAKHMVDRSWGATMMLTEPDAGSDVGAGKSKAILQSDGTWHITGNKRFITSGDADIYENIIHFVLARPVGHQGGTKGLSLFMIPKFIVDIETGEPIKRNGVFVTKLEEKMGLHASATCEIILGEHEPAVGYLLGDKHDGIAQMFKIIEFARMMVGTKAIAALSAGYLQALSYAKTRIQGGDLKDFANKNSPRVAIINHPDIRRSLITQKAYSEGLRALMLYTASIQDQILIYQYKNNLEETQKYKEINDLLLPIVKGYGSEIAWRTLGTESLQTFGGSGYTTDWPLEQYVRDAKIDTLYEGTTAIQGMDLFFRKIVKNNGIALSELAAQIKDTISNNNNLPNERIILNNLINIVEETVNSMIGNILLSQNNPEEIYKVGLTTTNLLYVLGDTITAWLLIKQADIASESIGKDNKNFSNEFYQGKIEITKFFINYILPITITNCENIRKINLDIMNIPIESF